MSQTPIKVSRRQIRRAFGADVMDTLVSHQDALKFLHDHGEATRHVLADLAADRDRLTRQVADLERRHPQTWTWGQRLRWLFGGRA